MANYDFHDLLSYLDFENLTQGLLEAELGIAFENFRDGPDGGIDMRHAPAKQAGKTIVQCKRHKTFASLKAELARNELAKIQALAPSRYLLSTSAALSPKQVDELVELLSPHVVSSGDNGPRARSQFDNGGRRANAGGVDHRPREFRRGRGDGADGARIFQNLPHEQQRTIIAVRRSFGWPRDFGRDSAPITPGAGCHHQVVVHTTNSSGEIRQAVGENSGGA